MQNNTLRTEHFLIKFTLKFDFFIGMSSGLSWLAWACNTKVVMISGVTIKENEFIIQKDIGIKY